MKKRLTYLSPIIIIALVLAGCSPAAGAPAAVQNAPAGQSAAAPQAAPTTETPSEANPVQPAAPAPQVNSGAMPEAFAALEGSLEAIYTKVGPSVVNIQVTTNAQSPASNLPQLPELPGNPFGSPNSPNQAPQSQALGSGFIWDKNGDIVTNNHVISGATKVTVTFSDGTTVDGTVVGADPDSDLAVVKVSARPELLVPVQMADSKGVKVGQLAIAIGNPFGLSGTMTVGIVSALSRTLPSDSNLTATGGTFTIPDIIQTDAPINPGNSGGVLLNDQGQVIGVTSAIESPVRASAGVGFAIPASIVSKFVPELIKNGKVQHPFIGISGTTMDPDLARAMNMNSDQRGILVINVTGGSPAEKAGLQGSSKQVEINGSQAQVGGDIITAINDQSTKDFDTLVAYLATSTNVNDTVKLTFLRGGKEMTANVTLSPRPASVANNNSNPAPQQAPSSGKAQLGVTVMDVTSEVAQAMNLPANTTGVLIQSVTSGSPAEKAGLQGSNTPATINGQSVMVGGDIITKADNTAVAAVKDLQSVISQHKPGDVITLSIIRAGKTLEVKATL